MSEDEIEQARKLLKRHIIYFNQRPRKDGGWCLEAEFRDGTAMTFFTIEAVKTFLTGDTNHDCETDD